MQGCAGGWEPVPPVHSQPDAQLGFAGEAAADEEVGLFPQLLGETLPRGCQGKCQRGDGAGSARWWGCPCHFSQPSPQDLSPSLDLQWRLWLAGKVIPHPTLQGSPSPVLQAGLA